MTPECPGCRSCMVAGVRHSAVVTNVQGRIVGLRGGYLASAGDDYIRKQVSDMRVLISRAQSNVVNWQRQLDDALAEADRRWGSDRSQQTAGSEAVTDAH